MGGKYFQPLQVDLMGKIRHHYDENAIFPVHELVIRPLLENSSGVFICKGVKEEFFLCGKIQVPIKLEHEEILIPDRGKFRFNRTKECIVGHEYLWNATMWKRGSIVMVIKPDKVDFAEIFKNTYNCDFTETPNSGHTLSAIKMCRAEMENGNIAIIFPASNGIEWMQIYAKGEAWDNILLHAKRR